MMEHFSEAFIRAIGAAAGCNFVEGPKFDDDSIDGGFQFFTSASEIAKLKSPRFEFQLKAYQYEIPSGAQSFSYQLKKKNYDDLRATNVSLPRILVVVLLPEDPTQWISHHAHLKLELYRHAYWLSLYGAPELPDEQESKTVIIPLNNEFTTAQVTSFVNALELGATHL